MTGGTSQARVLELEDIQGALLRQRPSPCTGTYLLLRVDDPADGYGLTEWPAPNSSSRRPDRTGRGFVRSGSAWGVDRGGDEDSGIVAVHRRRPPRTQPVKEQTSAVSARDAAGPVAGRS
jgi:hypothetical protein